MDVLAGLLIINEIDVYTQFGAYLAEEKEGDNYNYSALLKPPSTKPHVSVNIRENDGEKLPAKLLPKWEPRDITLRFAIVAADASQFLIRYSGFLNFLKSGTDGWLSVNLPELNKTFRFYYKDSGQYSQLADFSGGEVAAMFLVTFREPNPII